MSGSRMCVVIACVERLDARATSSGSRSRGCNAPRTCGLRAFALVSGAIRRVEARHRPRLDGASIEHGPVHPQNAHTPTVLIGQSHGVAEGAERPLELHRAGRLAGTV